jgi:integrase
VLDADSALVLRKAADISVDEFVELIGAVVDKGKGRTAGKVRSFLRAAYALAIRSKIDPALPQAMRTFGIVVNPLASTAALSQFNRTRKRHLNALELGAFLKRLDGLSPGPKRDALELSLILGGQRPTQLLRARATDADLPGGTITIYDPKGARTQPRVHMVPLTESSFEIVRRRLDAVQLAREEAKRKGEADNLLAAGSMWLFSTDDRTGMREETISELVKNLSEEMVKAGEAREPFQLRDLRRTTETMLTKLGTGPNIRGEIQSHGLGGVQKRHYDQHDYLEEKRAALQLWASHLAALKAGTAVGATARSENKITRGSVYRKRGRGGRRARSVTNQTRKRLQTETCIGASRCPPQSSSSTFLVTLINTARAITASTLSGERRYVLWCRRCHRPLCDTRPRTQPGLLRRSAKFSACIIHFRLA